jgi:uncharacterized protein
VFYVDVVVERLGHVTCTSATMTATVLQFPKSAGVPTSQSHPEGYPSAMDRPGYILAALAAAGGDVTLTPVQVQKLFFLLDRRAGHLLGGPHFAFEPYDYGPFDQAVYQELDALQRAGLVYINTDGRYRTYKLTPQGYVKGNARFETLSGPVREFVQQTIAWIRSLRFDQLVAAIYREYPEMKARSIFNQ